MSSCFPPFANCAKDEFTHIGGKLELDGTDITKSRVEASIDAATINTREPQRDAHLKSADFLDVEEVSDLELQVDSGLQKG